MFGLPFDWTRVGEDLLIIYTHEGHTHSVPTSDIDRSLIERVEVLAEAADRARLLLKLLPGRIDAAKTPQESAEVVTRDLLEAEDALWCALHPE